MDVADAIVEVFVSNNVADSNEECANIVDVIDSLSYSVKSIANAITPMGASPYRDEHGGVTASLTEAVISMASNLSRIADSISELASAVETTKDG